MRPSHHLPTSTAGVNIILAVLLLSLIQNGRLAQGFLLSSSLSTHPNIASSSSLIPASAKTRFLSFATTSSSSSASAFMESRKTAAEDVHHASGIGELAGMYDVFLIDQWGVMHDGHHPYLGAVECMEKLVQANKRIIVLSNSSKRKDGSVKRLKKMGFSPEDYVDCVTSGDLTFGGLHARTSPPYNEINGTRVLVFGNSHDDRDYLASLGCTFSGVEEADFLLARGPFSIIDSPEEHAEIRHFGPGNVLHESADFEQIAKRAIERGLPLIIANPDIVRPGGNNDPMPGLLGQRYEGLGGQVIYVGKPYPLVYQRCRELLGMEGEGGPEKKPLRICAIGDSMMNDILGAVDQGYASILITDGIHSEAMGVDEGSGQEVGRDVRDAFLKGFSYHPTYTVARFRW